MQEHQIVSFTGKLNKVEKKIVKVGIECGKSTGDILNEVAIHRGKAGNQVPTPYTMEPQGPKTNQTTQGPNKNRSNHKAASIGPRCEPKTIKPVKNLQ